MNLVVDTSVIIKAKFAFGAKTAKLLFSNQKMPNALLLMSKV